LQLKVSKATGNPYIVVTTGAEISHIPAKQNSVTETEESPEPMTAADSMIDNYILDRLYIYGRVERLVGYNYPSDKLAELSTAIHIELSRAGKSPRPTDQQLERKRVHKERTTPVEKMASVGYSGWRNFVHPLSGVKLGDEPVEKIGVTFAPWALKTDRDRLEDKMKPFHDAVMEATEDLGLEYQDILEAYQVSYIHGQEKETVKRKILTKKFDNGLVEHGYVKKEGQPTNKEALAILRHFPAVWKEIILS
jgi:hypothetical protein